MRESITSAFVLDVLRSIIRPEEVNEMLSCFMSELLIRMGAYSPVLNLITRCYQSRTICQQLQAYGNSFLGDCRMVRDRRHDGNDI